MRDSLELNSQEGQHNQIKYSKAKEREEEKLTNYPT